MKKGNIIIHRSRRRIRIAAAFRLTIAALLLGAALPAKAILITQTAEFQITNEQRGDSPSLGFMATIAKFDSTLGTLEQVDLRYDFDLDFTYNISNRTLSPLSVDIASNDLSIRGPRFFDRFAFDDLITRESFGGNTLAVPAGVERTFGSITLTLAGRAAETVNTNRPYVRTSRPLQIRNIVIRPQGDVSPFVGLGDMDFDFTAATRNPLNLPNSGNLLNGVTSGTSFELAGSVSVTYDYRAAPVVVPVPEPSSLALLGIGLLGLTRTRRKRL